MDIKSYILSVTAAGLLCCIATKLIGKEGAHNQLVKVAAGLILTFTVIRPLANIQPDRPFDWVYHLSLDGKELVSDGQTGTNDAVAGSIKQQLEAYILDKAAAYGAAVEVEVLVEQEGLPVPIGVILHGEVSPYVKVQLTNMIQTDLGITGEAQLWK